MELEIITVYVICCEFLAAMNHQEDSQCRMSDAEVMTTAIVAMLHFGGNYAKARKWLKRPQHIPTMVGRSRYSRRLNRLSHLFVPCFHLIGQYWKAVNPEDIYAIDTFPIPVCDNIRIKRAKIYQAEAYRGKIASKKRYFYGLKLHLMVTQHGQPVEFFISPGSFSDVTYMDQFDFDLPAGSTVYADKIYNFYLVEDCLLADGQIDFSPFRKSNSKRPDPAWKRFLQHHYRKIIETSGSLIERLLPKHIHATNSAGFELKVILFVLALSFDQLLKVAT
jgi:hypothetical protein